MSDYKFCDSCGKLELESKAYEKDGSWIFINDSEEDACSSECASKIYTEQAELDKIS